jgi:hypothetical protein
MQDGGCCSEDAERSLASGTSVDVRIRTFLLRGRYAQYKGL